MADEPTTTPPAAPAAPATPPPPAVPDPAAPAAPAVPAPAAPATPDAALGEGGEKALKAERQARADAEKALKDAQTAQQQQLDAIAKALGLKPDDTVDPATLTAKLNEEQAARAAADAQLLRYQVAVEKQVPAHLVSYVTGTDAASIEASVTKVLADFAASTAPGTPRPDPSQGPQGSPTSLDDEIAAAHKAGDIRTVMRLKARQAITPQ